ncbi:TRAP transporter substrate-binding protein [Aidingimonas lacisalsi]|uniref:TRAP transporter substrate-binding protein n=1 Tax=Aidingimonas lacisalsi TaxID=2604086 RepID=UPI0011D1EC4B|nr:TRAP transporter substrate-binding protein [Aidingimonas lacisalsi]
MNNENTPEQVSADHAVSTHVGQEDNHTLRTSRRRFLTGSAAAAGAAAIGFPSIAVAQTTTLRFQSTWPDQDIFHEFAADYVRIVNEMSGGRLELNLLPAGSVVGALELQDAVISGALDGGHGVCAYWYGKHKAYSLFGTPPPFGWDAHQFLAWFWSGEGRGLYNELLEMLELPLVGYLTGPMPTQALGWFKEPISGVEDLEGQKYRTVGLAADLMDEVGAAVTIMGGGDIVPAMDRGLLDGAEFNNPSSDRLLGFPDVSKTWMLRSYHQDCEAFEVMFNRDKFNSLDPEFQAILEYAAKAASSEMYWKAMDRYPKDLQAMREEEGVETYITPDSVLKAQLDAWDKVIDEQSEDAFFKKVIDSQRAYCERVVGWHLEGNAPKNPAYEHFFGRAATDTSKMA